MELLARNHCFRTGPVGSNVKGEGLLFLVLVVNLLLPFPVQSLFVDQNLILLRFSILPPLLLFVPDIYLFNSIELGELHRTDIGEIKRNREMRVYYYPIL